MYNKLFFQLVLTLILAACTTTTKPSIVEQTDLTNAASQVITTPTKTVIPPILTPIPPEPQATPVNTEPLQETRHGITLQITDIVYLADRTTINIQIGVNADWHFDLNAFPPQGIMLRNPRLLDDQGNEIAPKGFSGNNAYSNANTGSVFFDTTLEFDAISPQAKTLTLEVDAEATELKSNEPLQLDLAGHKWGDQWEVNKTVLVGEMPFTVSEMRLSPAGDALVGDISPQRSMLELIVAPNASGDLEPVCLFVVPEKALDTPRGCGGNGPGENSITYLALDNIPTEPLVLFVTGYIFIRGPWQLTWSVGNSDTGKE